jgi:hypothetical protein
MTRNTNGARIAKTEVKSLRYDFKRRRGDLYLGYYGCSADGRDAIALFKRIDPKVERICIWDPGDHERADPGGLDMEFNRQGRDGWDSTDWRRKRWERMRAAGWTGRRVADQRQLIAIPLSELADPPEGLTREYVEAVNEIVYWPLDKCEDEFAQFIGFYRETRRCSRDWTASWRKWVENKAAMEEKPQ